VTEEYISFLNLARESRRFRSVYS